MDLQGLVETVMIVEETFHLFVLGQCSDSQLVYVSIWPRVLESEIRLLSGKLNPEARMEKLRTWQ